MQTNIALTFILITALVTFARPSRALGEKGALARAFANNLSGAARNKFWSGEGTITSETIDIAGVKREYYIYKPKEFRPRMQTVFAFHGGGGTARGMDRCCGGLTSAADRYGFVVIFPQGLERHWNDGREVNASSKREDVQFISDVIDNLVASGVADRTRIYATGISNGGFFSEYLALQLPDKLAAVAPVAATLSVEQIRSGSQPHSVPIAFFSGTKDPVVPFNGGSIGAKSRMLSRGNCLSAHQAVQFWLERNHASSNGVATKVADDGRILVTKTQFGDSGSPSEVLFYQIDGGGHTLPGGAQYLPPAIIGHVCSTLSANDAILQFFQLHHLQQ